MLRVARALARVSAVQALQYRVEALGEALLTLVRVATAVVPLLVVFGQRQSVEGWTRDEMLIVLGWFTFLTGVLEGTLSPSLLAVIEQVRNGTLDFVLIKPADAQLLVSFSKLSPTRIVDLVCGLGLIVTAFVRMGRWPSPGDLALSFVLLLSALAVLYSIALLVVSIAFVAVRVDNLFFLFTSTFDLARWPTTIFGGVLRIIFTFVLPLALMTTVPALAVLGKLEWTNAVGALLGSVAFFLIARFVWLRSLARYTSASS
ncbi:MAG: ABC-2 family transporter protein [Deltaproteobacteria bacterium]|nr:ABC-2 family transporter protein [Deltaproteobacteria bacterium]